MTIQSPAASEFQIPTVGKTDIPFTHPPCKTKRVIHCLQMSQSRNNFGHQMLQRFQTGCIFKQHSPPLNKSGPGLRHPMYVTGGMG